MELINECWEKDIFPKVWKSAKIIWIPKKDGSLRPISILPSIWKILDKIIKRRLQRDLEREKASDENKYAYK